MTVSRTPQSQVHSVEALPPRSFTASRLRLARRRRGLTLTALSAASSLSTRSLSAYENGETEPTLQSLEILARVMRFPVQFFVDGHLDEIPVEAVSFRAQSKMTARQRDVALSSGRIAALFDDWLAERFTLPPAELPTFSDYSPATAAESLRARWGLGERPIRNMLHLVEAHGVRVYSLPEDTANLDAFSLVWEGQPLILLDVKKSGERGRFDVAHELGHLVLHRERTALDRPQVEAEANAFASAFLMPAASVRGAGLVNPTVPTVLRAKRRWSVSAMALVHRLRELDLVSEWNYRTLCVQLSQQGYRSTEPGGVPRESSQLLTKALTQLRQEGTGLADIARDLAIEPGDLKDYLFRLTLTVA